MKKVVIIDYSLSNLFSVSQACKHVGIEAKVSFSPEEISLADAIILPGVGAFQTAMLNLASLGLIDPIKDFISSGKPFFGVCLGLQLLFTESGEFGQFKGLDIIRGKITKFPNFKSESTSYKVPQIGWNKINSPENSNFENSPLRGLSQGEFMYFVHSYYAVPENTKNILTVTDYSDTIYCSGVLKDNIFAVQFHPEKSGKMGLQIYKNWAIQNNLL